MIQNFSELADFGFQEMNKYPTGSRLRCYYATYASIATEFRQMLSRGASTEHIYAIAADYYEHAYKTIRRDTDLNDHKYYSAKAVLSVCSKILHR